MGFKKAKARVLSCLTSGHVLHEERNNIDIKNLLATGQVPIEVAAQIIGRATGSSYSFSPHHFDKNIDVHVIKTSYSSRHWYINWYFLNVDSVFISFHH